ncbi:hypothetical protein [uncultured Methanobrevibacter sp.]|uniref:hypothetical protein n=1 Tax=uncultured Methanobrevibacter sp. TaxID=253161 RepID=UPI0025E9C68A|nr:hypothetical protein [uncultured Methanobrevibacter sp.]
MFVKCKCFRYNRRKSRISHNQESDIGYCEYFHMSRANMLSKLRGHSFSMSKKISHEAHYHFFRSSTWAKLERDRRKPYFSPEEWMEMLNEEP